MDEREVTDSKRQDEVEIGEESDKRGEEELKERGVSGRDGAE